MRMDEGEATCKRTGVCCQRLYSNVMPVLAKKFLLRKMRKQYKNTKPSISRAWIEDGEKAKSLGLSYFPCRFLTEDNVCSLQDKKPEVCSYSLSPEALEKEKEFIHNAFFHHKCGYLTGAPDYIVRANRIMNALEEIRFKTDRSWKIYKRFWSLEFRLREIEADPRYKGWRIVNKEWVKE